MMMWLLWHALLLLLQPEIELPAALVEDSEEAEQRAIEERRKRLAEIKAKHQLAAAAAGEPACLTWLCRTEMSLPSSTPTAQ